MARPTFIPVLALTAVAAAQPATRPANVAATRPTSVPATLPVSVHDPVLIRENDTYYLFGTGRGIPARASRDLKTWHRVPSPFEGLALPAWAKEKVPDARDLWAPDISLVDGEYRLYYAASKFGTRQSVLGLTTNKTLDPNSPDYRWQDRGLVLQTNDSNDFNAIDAAAFVDADGKNWMAIGSFWTGIKLFALDKKTGKLADPDEKPVSLARRREAGGAVEAAFVTRRDGWYYLWVSFDACCRGAASTYNTRVGRSRGVAGPYVDQAGRPMLDGGGTVVVESHDNVRGPGHNAVFTDTDGTDYLVHHWYDADRNGRRTLGLRKMTWTPEGWPVAGPLMPTEMPTTRPTRLD